jgi:hypothetical protein
MGTATILIGFSIIGIKLNRLGEIVNGGGAIALREAQGTTIDVEGCDIRLELNGAVGIRHGARIVIQKTLDHAPEIIGIGIIGLKADDRIRVIQRASEITLRDSDGRPEGTSICTIWGKANDFVQILLGTDHIALAHPKFGAGGITPDKARVYAQGSITIGSGTFGCIHATLHNASFRQNLGKFGAQPERRIKIRQGSRKVTGLPMDRTAHRKHGSHLGIIACGCCGR